MHLSFFWGGEKGKGGVLRTSKQRISDKFLTSRNIFQEEKYPTIFIYIITEEFNVIKTK